MFAETLYVGCSQNHLLPGCDAFLAQHGIFEKLPYMHVVPNGARDLERFESTLGLLRSIGGEGSIRRIILALKDSERYHFIQALAIETAREFFPHATIDVFRPAISCDLEPRKDVHIYVRCMDGRLVSACKDMCKRLRLETGMYDVLSYPGGAGKHTWLNQDMCRYRTKGIQVTRVVATTHDDCKAGKSAHDLLKAERIIKFYFPEADVVCEHFCRESDDTWRSRAILDVGTPTEKGVYVPSRLHDGFTVSDSF